jgi:hypothetical protein
VSWEGDEPNAAAAEEDSALAAEEYALLPQAETVTPAIEATGVFGSLANISPWTVQARLISPFHPVLGRLHKKVGCKIGVCLMVFGRLHMLSGLTTFPTQVFSLPPSSSPPSSSSLTHHGRDGATSMEGEHGRSATRWRAARARRDTVELRRGSTITTRWRGARSRRGGGRARGATAGGGRARPNVVQGEHEPPTSSPTATLDGSRRHPLGTPPPSSSSRYSSLLVGR